MNISLHECRWSGLTKGGVGALMLKKPRCPPEDGERHPPTHSHSDWVSVWLFYLFVFPRWGGFLRLFASAFICFLASLQSHVTGSQLVTLKPIKIPAILRWSIIRAVANSGTWLHTRHSLHLLLSSPSSRGQKGKKKNMCFLSLFLCLHNSLAGYIFPLQCV